MAEGTRFELAVVLPTLVFKTSALNHSATLPRIYYIIKVYAPVWFDYNQYWT